MRGKHGLVTHHVKGLHEGHALCDIFTGQLEHQKRRMAFVHVPDRRSDTHLTQGAHATNAKHQFLGDAQFVVATVQTGRQITIGGAVGVNVGIQQIERHAPYLEVIDFGVNRTPRQLDIDDYFVAVGGQGRASGDIGKAHFAIERFLPATMIEALAEVALGIDETNRDQRQIEVTGFFDVVTSQNSQAAGINGQGFVQTKLRRKISNSAFFGGVGAFEPGVFAIHVGIKRNHYGIVVGQPGRIVGGSNQIALAHVAQKLDRVVVD